MPQRHRDSETEGQRDRGTEGQRDRGTEGQRDRETKRWERIFPPSLRLSVCLSLLLSIPPWLCGSVAGQTGSFEKQAISSARKVSASELDAELPERSFAGWFDQIVGPKAGVVWQLTECGDQIVAPDKPEQDLPACAEVNANLPDGRKVFVAISVGTFKKGLNGKPTFFRAVIEQNEQFHQVRRLRDLPQMLRAPEGSSATRVKNQIAALPAIKMDSAWVIRPLRQLTPPPSKVPPVPGGLKQAEEPPEAPPEPQQQQPEAPQEPPPEPSTQAPEVVPESVSQSRAITKVKPAYPPTAKKMNATGTVEVEITISEAGLVVEATAISGHLALRSAAVDAARKWVFNPAILNGAPVRVKSVLTFVFAPSAK
jgi:TonB family protein